MRTSHQHKKWKWLAPLGLTLIGTGISITGEAIILKSQSTTMWIWIALGTLGLIILNAGISVFGEAVKQSTLDTWKREQELNNHQ